MRYVAALVFLFSMISCSKVPDMTTHNDSRPALIRALDGRWTMTGDVMGKPVTYDLSVRPVLNNTFTELHMKDVQTPPQYEARVFIGYDNESKTIIAHWLDSFGAKYSVPHGEGSITEDEIQFIVPYEQGSFRDTLKYDADHNIWQLLIQMHQPDDSWKHFAEYVIKPF